MDRYVPLAWVTRELRDQGQLRDDDCYAEGADFLEYLTPPDDAPLVNRAARATYAHFAGNAIEPWEALSEGQRQWFLDAARSILDATLGEEPAG